MEKNECIDTRCLKFTPFDLTCQSSLRGGVRASPGVARTWNGLDGTYGKKGCDRRKNGMRIQRGEKAECGARSAVDGCGRDYEIVRGCGWLSCEGTSGKHQKQCLVAL